MRKAARKHLPDGFLQNSDLSQSAGARSTLTQILPVFEGLAQGFHIHVLHFAAQGDALSQAGYAHMGEAGVDKSLQEGGCVFRLKGCPKGKDDLGNHSLGKPFIQKVQVQLVCARIFQRGNKSSKDQILPQSVTMHRVSCERVGSEHKGHVTACERPPQRLHRCSLSRSWTMLVPSSLVRASGQLKSVIATRRADFGPMPGRRLRRVTTSCRASGSSQDMN